MACEEIATVVESSTSSFIVSVVIWILGFFNSRIDLFIKEQIKI